MTVDLTDLGSLVGQEIGTSDWIVITQDRIDAFADATDDHQWIHVDSERASAETPFGTTIAHGFLTLSLIGALMRDAVTVDGPRMTLNYGLNRVRFVSPVPSGSRIRARVVLAGMDDMGDSSRRHGTSPSSVKALTSPLWSPSGSSATIGPRHETSPRG